MHFRGGRAGRAGGGLEQLLVGLLGELEQMVLLGRYPYLSPFRGAPRGSDFEAVARALEEVTLRAVGDETAKPYPGLAAFQQEDARFFFGRELEVEALWKKLRRPHLLAVIGPSGAGKSLLMRALSDLDPNQGEVSLDGEAREAMTAP